jgi:NAD-dependent SIR2 family protein deacetylase
MEIGLIIAGSLILGILFHWRFYPFLVHCSKCGCEYSVSGNETFKERRKQLTYCRCCQAEEITIE